MSSSGPSTTPTSGAKTLPSIIIRHINTAPAPEQRKTKKKKKKRKKDDDDDDDDDDATGTLASSAMIHIYLPVLINWIGIVSLIFGGCCSNVSHDHRWYLGHSDLT